jgi:hypothetical protein
MKFAIVHNWPGMRNAELEIINRVIRIAGSLGHEGRIISPFCHLLDSRGEHIDRVEFVDMRDYDFCLNLHYVNPNFFDTFSYVVNWNPFDYVARDPVNGKDFSIEQIAYHTACIESHDAILSAGSAETNELAAALNLVAGQQLSDKDLYLHTTSTIDEKLSFPDLASFRVFYIFANWERMGGWEMHAPLIKLLDKTDKFTFYGVTKPDGINLWKGISNYKGSLPFDGGKSILTESNTCGVSLVLNSKAHRRSGLVSTRIFQACAAKTIAICDNHPFIMAHFGDSVLAFKYTDDPEKNFKAIMEQVAWIERNPRMALEKAQTAHYIFKEKFSLESELANLFEKHEARVQRYRTEFCARDSHTCVDVLYIHKGARDTWFEYFLADVKAQAGMRTRAVVFVQSDFLSRVERELAKNKIQHKIIEYHPDADGRLPLDGRLVSRFIKDHAENGFFILYSHCCRWKRLHLTHLVRAASEENGVAMSGTWVKYKEFSELADEYYQTSMNSIGGFPKGIGIIDIGRFRARRFVPASILFNTEFFKRSRLLSGLRFFDKGWAFFMVVWYYIKTKKLPVFISKLTVAFQRDDALWNLDAYIDGQQSEEFERSLCHAFLKKDPFYLSICEWAKTNNIKGTIDKRLRSIYTYFSSSLKNKPFFLKIGLFFLVGGRLLLGWLQGKSFDQPGGNHYR